jgi:septal ring factor EnvC (AmiA/AmiB activator)
MQTRLGQEIATLSEGIRTWHDQLAALQDQVSQQAQEIATLQQQIAASTTLTISSALNSPTEQSLLTPPTSDQVAEALETTQEILPIAQPLAVAAENPEVVRPKRRFL